MSGPRGDGGPAFPVLDQGFVPGSGGMSLRDYFAGQALVGILASTPLLRGLADGRDSQGVPAFSMRRASVLAFDLADTMLAERIRDRAAEAAAAK